MALYHLQVKTVSRATGRTAPAAAAYRSGTRIVAEQDGVTHDYRRRSGVESAFILTPEGADWALDRSALWNGVEAAEKRKDAKLAREYELGLPHELDADGRRALAEGFAREVVTRFGVVADVAIHLPGREGDDRNHHAHIMTSTRAANADGLGAKTRELDDPRTSGALVESLRELWAIQVNAALERIQSEARVDHRSYARQGDGRQAGQHLGPAASALERASIQTRIGDVGRAAAEHNAALGPTKVEQVVALDRHIERARRRERSERRVSKARSGLGLDPERPAAAAVGAARREKSGPGRAASATPVRSTSLDPAEMRADPADTHVGAPAGSAAVSRDVQPKAVPGQAPKRAPTPAPARPDRTPGETPQADPAPRPIPTAAERMAALAAREAERLARLQADWKTREAELAARERAARLAGASTAHIIPDRTGPARPLGGTSAGPAGAARPAAPPPPYTATQAERILREGGVVRISADGTAAVFRASSEELHGRGDASSRGGLFGMALDLGRLGVRPRLRQPGSPTLSYGIADLALMLARLAHDKADAWLARLALATRQSREREDLARRQGTPALAVPASRPAPSTPASVPPAPGRQPDPMAAAREAAIAAAARAAQVPQRQPGTTGGPAAGHAAREAAIAAAARAHQAPTAPSAAARTQPGQEGRPERRPILSDLPGAPTVAVGSQGGARVGSPSGPATPSVAPLRAIGAEAAMAMLRADGVIQVDGQGQASFAVRADAPPGDRPGLHGLEEALTRIGATWSRAPSPVKGWHVLRTPRIELGSAIGRLAKPIAERWIERLAQATRESGANLTVFRQLAKGTDRTRKGPGIGD